MNYLPCRRLSVVALSTLLSACVDGLPPTALENTSTVNLGAAPRFSVAPSASLVAQLDRARISLLDVATDSVVASVEQTIDLTADEWAFEMTVDLRRGETRAVRLDIELLSGTAALETVEFSGRTHFDVRASYEPTDIQEVTLGRGPLANLSLTRLELSRMAPSLREGGSDALVLDTVGAAPGQIVFYESLDPSVATVDALGGLRGRRHGGVRVLAQAGRVADTLDLSVDAVPLPAPDELRRLLVPHVEYVASDVFLATLSNRPAAAAISRGLEDLVAEMLAGRVFESVELFEHTRSLWESYGDGTGLRILDGPQLGVLSIALMHAADALGLAFQ